jgi:hypothetical protein
MGSEYRALTKARGGIRWKDGCYCCSPKLTGAAARRVVRRKARENMQSREAYSRGDAWGDDHDYYSGEIDAEFEEGDESGVRWRMTLDPFRIVPVWVRPGQEEQYALQRVCWVLGGDGRLCSHYGVPTTLCTMIWGLVEILIMLHDEPHSIDEIGASMRAVALATPWISEWTSSTCGHHDYV